MKVLSKRWHPTPGSPAPPNRPCDGSCDHAMTYRFFHEGGGGEFVGEWLRGVVNGALPDVYQDDGPGDVGVA